jgi:short-subunit dehydrogenase
MRSGSIPTVVPANKAQYGKRMHIKDSVIIITGASSGIGLATARILAREGARVVLAARSEKKLAEIEKEIPNSFAIPADMEKPQDIAALVQKTKDAFGRIDVLINNAGQGLMAPLEHVNLDDYQKIMNLNVFAIVRAMQAVIPIMREQGGGMILNISSRVSKNYFPSLSAYASTKYALNAITLTARQELEKDNIVVSVFHPKMTATDFDKNARGEKYPSRPRPGAASAGTAMGVDTAEEVAEKIVKQIESEVPEATM